MFLTLNSSHFVSCYFFVEQNVIVIIKFDCDFTPFAKLNSLTSTERIQCIFDFNPMNSLTVIPLNTSLILPITFLLVGQKTLIDIHYSQTTVYI